MKTICSNSRWMSLGIAIGTALGVAFDNIGVGVALGLAIGVALDGNRRNRC